MNEVQNEKKVSTGMVVLITLLVVLLVGCISFIVYDKFIKKENSNPTITDKDKNNEATGENKDAEVELKSWMTYLLNSDIDNIELERAVCPNEYNTPADCKVETKFVTKEDLKNIFKKLNDEGKTIILVTHQMDHVINYASRIIVFNESKIEFDGIPYDLFKNENLVKKLNLDLPNIFKLVSLTSKKYPEMKNYHIENISQFINAYKEIKKL